MNKLLFVSVFLLSLLMVSTVQAAAYIKFDGIDGESKDDKHDKWIDVLSIDWGMHLPGSGTSSTRRRGRPVVEDFSFVKEVDKSSPLLMQALTDGEVISEVTVEVTRGLAEAEVVYMVYTFTDVKVSSYNIGSSGLDGVRSNIGSSGEDGVSFSSDRPLELVSLNAEHVEFSYTEFDDQSRNLGVVSFLWNILRGRR